MIDIKRLRENKDFVTENLKKRNKDYTELILKIVEADKKRRDVSAKHDQLRAKQNEASKVISKVKREGKNPDKLMDEMKALSKEIKELAQEASRFEEQQKSLLLNLPNTVDESVPVGADDADNEEVRRWGEIPQFEFDPKPHWEIGNDLGILDSKTAAKVTGSRFHFYRGKGAKLERAVINFYLEEHAKRGYEEVFPPFLVNRDSMTGTGQLPKFEEDAFKIKDVDYFLIPTAEVPVTNMFRGEIIDGAELPIKYCAYSACFRKEAGSAGRDVHGLIRQHQFNKVELVKFVNPKESYQQLESLVDDAQNVLKLLGLPHRVVTLCGGDLGFSSAKTYDIEVYMPSYNDYKEISSCSNFEDYQARRANIRFKNSADSKAEFVHTLNGSGVAVGRTVAAILENFQQKDGTVKVPEPLREYMKTDVLD